MKLPVIATEGHQGETLEVDCDQETMTLVSPQGNLVGSVTWGSVIEHIGLTSKEEAGANTRTHPRAPLAVKVRCTTDDGRQFECLTGGVGGGGLFIENGAPLPPGTQLTVEFTLPDRPTEILTAKAKVAWVRSKAERYLLFPGMGVQFTDMEDNHRKRVAELVDALTRARQGG